MEKNLDELTWYRCRRDRLVVTTNLCMLILFLIIIGEERIGDGTKWIFSWGIMSYLGLLSYYIGLSMWPYAISIAIIAAFLCSNHYWKWIGVSWVAISIISDYSITLYGFKKITVQLFLEGIGTYLLLNFIGFLHIAGIIYIIKKKSKEREKNNE